MSKFPIRFTELHLKFPFRFFLWALLIFSPVVVSKTDFSRSIEIKLSKNAPLPAPVSVDGCTLFDVSGRFLRAMAGYLCIPVAGKGHLAVTGDYSSPELSFFDAEGKTLWKKNQPAHHQLDSKKDLLYVLSHHFQTWGVRKIRFDTISVFDLQGEQKWHWSTEKMIEENNLVDGGFQASFQNKIEGGFYEYTHINSFLTDPSNPEKLLIALPNYGLLLNLNLKTGEYSQFARFENIKGIHSLQRSGDRILFFANTIKGATHSGKSAIVELTSTGKLIKIHTQFAGRSLFSKTRGSIRVSPIGLWLISQGDGDFFVFNPKTMEVVADGKVIVTGSKQSFLTKIYSMEWSHVSD